MADPAGPPAGEGIERDYHQLMDDIHAVIAKTRQHLEELEKPVG